MSVRVPNRARSGLWLVGLAAALTACAPNVTVDQTLPPAPQTWSAPEQAVDYRPGEAEAEIVAEMTEARPLAPDWLARFGDPMLYGLVAEALAKNNDLQRTGALLRAARGDARVTGSVRLPSLDGTGSGSERTTVGGQGDNLTRSDSSSLSLGLQTSWELDLWGRLRDRSNAALADAAAAEADFEAARLSLAGAVAQGWFALVEATLQTQLSERDVETQAGSLRLVERRFNRGLSESRDLRLARSALASRQAVLETNRQLEGEAARRLEVLLGRYPSAEIQAASEAFTQVLPTLPPVPGTGTPGEILSRRPDLRAAALRLDAAGLRSLEAQKALLPRLSLTGSASTDGDGIADLLNPDRIAASIIGSLTAPLYRGGQLRGAAQAARARADAAVYSYVSAALTGYREAEDAIAAEYRLAARVSALTIAFDEALAAEELTEREYANGVATIFELLDAQSRRISSESQLIAAQRARADNRVRLHLALGGGFTVPDNAFVEPQEQQ